MKIVVTQDDIDNGRRESPTHCPIALAARRQFPHRYVLATADHLLVGGLTYYWLPPVAVSFVDDFDEGYPVQPISFEVTDDVCP